MQDPIFFPVLMNFDGRLVPCGYELMRDWKLLHRKENEFTYQESKKGPQSHMEWIIDGLGQYREVTDIGRIRGWAALFNVIWTVTGRRCIIESPKAVTVGFLLEKLNRMKKKHQTERSFTFFLKRFEPETLFTLEMFGEFMNEKQLPLPQTYPAT